VIAKTKRRRRRRTSNLRLYFRAGIGKKRGEKVCGGKVSENPLPHPRERMGTDGEQMRRRGAAAQSPVGVTVLFVVGPVQ